MHQQARLPLESEPTSLPEMQNIYESLWNIFDIPDTRELLEMDLSIDDDSSTPERAQAVLTQRQNFCSTFQSQRKCVHVCNALLLDDPQVRNALLLDELLGVFVAIVLCSRSVSASKADPSRGPGEIEYCMCVTSRA